MRVMQGSIEENYILDFGGIFCEGGENYQNFHKLKLHGGGMCADSVDLECKRF
jgi:hypothetical protein